MLIPEAGTPAGGSCHHPEGTMGLSRGAGEEHEAGEAQKQALPIPSAGEKSGFQREQEAYAWSPN